MLLHARCGPASSRLVNGTTASVTAVDDDGLTVRIDGGRQAHLPAQFVQGTRKDGSPNLSHAWARTIDGAQGGTWETCHLLGTSALDAYRGYTGQSRSRRPTHTWNTAKVLPVDHGGLLADQRGPAELVAAALAREPDPRLAARSDPWSLDRQLRDLISEHERVLGTRPADLSERIHSMTADLQVAESQAANTDDIATHTAGRLADLGRLSALRRRGREDRRDLQAKLTVEDKAVASARGRVADLTARVAELRRGQGAYEHFELIEGWRRGEITRLRARLDHHWADVITACVRGDDPLAYGTDKLRQARATATRELDHVRERGGTALSELKGTVDLLDAALERTRAGRVLVLASQPPTHLVDLLGPPPRSSGGRAVWCHYALGVEAVLDRGGTPGSWRGRSGRARLVRQQVSLADRALPGGSGGADPAEWSKLARDTAKVFQDLRDLAQARSLPRRGRVAATAAGNSVEQPFSVGID